MGSAREYAILYVRGTRVANTIVGGGNAVLATGQHALDGPEHTGQLPIERISTDETDTSLVARPDGAGGVEFAAESAAAGGSGGFDVTPPLTLALPPWVKPTGSGAITLHPDGRITIDSGSGYKSFPGMAFLEGRLHLVYRDGSAHNSAGGVIKYTYSDRLGAAGSWASPTTIYTPPGSDDYRDPCIAALSSGRLLLSLHRATTGGTVVVEVLTGYSDNRGQSWSSLTAVTTTFTGEVACSGIPVELPNGKIVLPGYGNDSGASRYTSAMWTSTDGVAFGDQVTVATSGSLSFDEWQPRLLSSGELVGLIREETTGHTYRTVCTDYPTGTFTWSAPTDVISSTAGRPDWSEIWPGVCLWFGRGTSGRSRWAVSWDECVTWSALQETDSGETREAEYHSVVVLAQGYAVVAYSLETSSSDAELYFRALFDGFGIDPAGFARLAGLTVGGIELDLSDPDDEEVLTYDAGSGTLVLAPPATPATSDLILVDHGTPTYDDSGADIDISIATLWGIDADGPYYDDTGAAAGEEAALYWDPTNQNYVVRALEVEP